LPPESVALKTNVLLEDSEVVPDIKPVEEFNVIPVGNDPDINEYVIVLLSVADNV
jgi:hypothetical protein